MDPSQYYNQGQSHRSLASTTDSTQYQHSQQQGGAPPGYPQYNQQASQMNYQSVQAGYMPSSHSQRSGGQPMVPNASYPGAMVQGSSTPQLNLHSGRPRSTPGGQGYDVYGQMPQGYPPAGVSSHTQYVGPQPTYAPTALSQPAYPSQYPQGPLQSAHPHRSHPAASPVTIPSSTSPGIERYPCDKCDKTFSRAHDRKRHYETHHASKPPSHKCQFCRKDFSRADSLKRHIDNGCEKDPSYTS